jgi:hypothetical protein
MKIFAKMVFLVLVLLSASNLAAQENSQGNKDLLLFYDSELFQWSYDMWGGLTVNYQNQNSGTMFGLKDSMQEALASYEDTNEIFLSYKKKTLIGNILFWGGTAVMAASPIVLAFDPFEGGKIKDSTLYTYLGITGGGLLTMIIGVIVLDLGTEDVFDAVHLYNRNKIAEYRGY